MEKHLLDEYTVEAILGTSTVRIVSSGNMIRYTFTEPSLTDEDAKVIQEIIKSGKAGEYTRNDKNGLSSEINYHLRRDTAGFDRIDVLMRDPNIEDISCEGPGSEVQVFLRKYGYIPSGIIFQEEELDRFVRRLVQGTGKQISSAVPMVDTTLSDGSRLHAFLGDYVSTKGSSFTIRRFREKPLSFIDLIQLGTADDEIMAFLWVAIQYGSNVMVIGGTASGKTSFLNSILQFIPASKKLVTIEDIREINIIHENWLQMVTRPGAPGTAESSHGGEIDMFKLLEASLRHRPNYLVVGEVRGRESYTVFQAMSAGRYALSTFHADDFEAFVHRMESNPINIPRQLISSLDLVILIRSLSTRNGLIRKVQEISELVEMDSETGEIVTNVLYRLDGDSYTFSGNSYLLQRISFREGISEGDLLKQVKQRKLLLEKLREKGITDYNKLSSVVLMMERDPGRVIEEFGIKDQD
jgi:flagellar protein FlaI